MYFSKITCDFFKKIEDTQHLKPRAFQNVFLYQGASGNNEMKQIQECAAWLDP